MQKLQLAIEHILQKSPWYFLPVRPGLERLNVVPHVSHHEHQEPEIAIGSGPIGANTVSDPGQSLLARGPARPDGSGGARWAHGPALAPTKLFLVPGKIMLNWLPS